MKRMMFGLGKGSHHRIRESLSAYVDGEVTEAERLQVERHLETCADCRAEADSLRSLVGLLRRMPEIEPPRSFTLAEAPAPVRGMPALQWALRTTALSTAFVLAVVFSADLAGVLPGDPAGIGVAPAPVNVQQSDMSQESGEPAAFSEADAAKERGESDGPQEPPQPLSDAPEATPRAAALAEDSIGAPAESASVQQPTPTRPRVEAARSSVPERQPPDTDETASNAYLPAIEGSLVALLVGAGGASLFLAVRRRRSSA